MDLYAAPQTLAKVALRRRLNLVIAGEGAPTVIFAPGHGATALHWARVQHPLSASTRTVAYENAGFGFSDPGPLPRTASAILDDLRSALRAKEIYPPYVLVGHSMGGMITRLFAFRHPEDVVGMVMVDTATEFQPLRFQALSDPQIVRRQRRFDTQMRRAMIRAERLARSGGLVPGVPEYDQFVGPPWPALTPAVNAARKTQLTSPGRFRAVRSELAHLWSTSSEEIAAARRRLGKMPLIVLTAGRGQRAPDEPDEAFEIRQTLWRTLHQEFAALSACGEQRTVDAGHNIALEKPEAVIAAVEEVMAMARAT
jgi:pimeloyl-ACP methyl ester carboxylesterase